MSFDFNFFNDNNNNEIKYNNNDDLESLKPCKLINKPNDVNLDSYTFYDLKIQNYSLKFIHDVNKRFDTRYDCDKNKKYDLIPNIYEGGYKIWECSIDLAEYCIDFLYNRDVDLTQILELGCGHGIPGCLALTLGFSKVIFTDYNEDVLQNCTWINILLNCKNVNIENIKCYSGDWLTLSTIINQDYDRSNNKDVQFDIILSAETLYSSSSCDKILRMLILHLKENGTALFATKRFYFGVGGGTQQLQLLIDTFNSGINIPFRFSFNIVKTIEDGLSNVRDIIEITKFLR